MVSSFEIPKYSVTSMRSRGKAVQGSASMGGTSFKRAKAMLSDAIRDLE